MAKDHVFLGRQVPDLGSYPRQSSCPGKRALHPRPRPGSHGVCVRSRGWELWVAFTSAVTALSLSFLISPVGRAAAAWPQCAPGEPSLPGTGLLSVSRQTPTSRWRGETGSGLWGGSHTLGTPCFLSREGGFVSLDVGRDGAQETGRQGDCKPGGVLRLPHLPQVLQGPPGGGDL